MLSSEIRPKLNYTFGNVEHQAILDTKAQLIARIKISSGKCFEAKQQIGREETVTVIKGTGKLVIGNESKEISPVSLVKLTANKLCQIFNNSLEMIELCFVSTPSENKSEEVYVRHKKDCDEIKAGNRERIYELFGLYGNGPAINHSVALVEIEEEGASHPHIHPVVEESYVIIDGIAKLTIGEKTSEIKADDVALIPVGQRHQIANIGKGVLLRLLAFVTPPWKEGCAIYETGT